MKSLKLSIRIVTICQLLKPLQRLTGLYGHMVLKNMRRARSIDYPTEYANLITTATSEDHLVELYNQWIESQMSIIQPVLDELNSKQLSVTIGL